MSTELFNNQALDRQVGGVHYKGPGIQPVIFCEHNRLPFSMSNAIKYLCRYKTKNGRQDLEKALHYIEMGASFYQELGNPFRSDHEWRIEADDFVRSNGLKWQERDAVLCLCAVDRLGLEGYITAHACVTLLLRNYDGPSPQALG